MSPEARRRDVNRLSLQWHGPFTWTRQEGTRVFDSPVVIEPGVYVFTVPHGAAFLAYYVGQTGQSFRKRLEAHTKEYLSGVYRTYAPALFVAGQKELVWGGLWKKDRVHLWPDFLERYVELALTIYRFLSCFRLFLAPIKADRRVRERVEAAVAEALRNQNERTRAFFDDVVKYRPRTADEEPFILMNESGHVRLGLAARMEA